MNSPCLAPFAVCSGLFLQIRDKWTSNNSKTSLRKLKYQVVGFGDGAEFLSCAYIFFKGFFEYFFQDEKGNFTVRNCDFDFNYNSREKLSVMYLNRVKNCLQLVFTLYVLVFSTSQLGMLFFLRVYVVGKNQPQKNRSTLKSYRHFLIVIVHMQVALTRRVHAIWLAFENLVVLISPKLHSKSVITNTNCCENNYNELHQEWMRCSRVCLNKLYRDNIEPLHRSLTQIQNRSTM